MANDNEAITIIGYKTDQASVDKAVQSAIRVAESNSKIGVSVDKVASSAARARSVIASYDTSLSRLGAQGGSALATARSAAGAAGGVLSTVGGSQAASAVSSILGLTATLGPLGLAAGVTTVGISLLTAESERLAKASREAANELKDRAELVASGATTADVTAQVDRLQTAQGYLNDNLSMLNGYYDKLAALEDESFDGPKAEEARAAMAAIFEEVSAVAGLDITEFATLHDHIQDVTSDSKDFTDKILDLNLLIRSGALEANNTAAAAEALTKAEEGLAKARTRQIDNAFALLDRESALRVDIAKTESEIAALDKAKALDIQQVHAVQASKLLDIETEAGEERASIARASADSIYKINRDAGRAIGEAVGDREADAFRQATTRRKDALEDEALGDKERRTTLALRLDKEHSAIAQAARLDLDTINTALRAESAIKRESLSRQNFELASNISSQSFLTQQGMSSMVNETASGWAQVTNNAAVALNTIAGMVTSVLGGTRFPTPSTVTGTYGAAGPSMPSEWVKQVKKVAYREAGQYMYDIHKAAGMVRG